MCCSGTKTVYRFISDLWIISLSNQVNYSHPSYHSLENKKASSASRSVRTPGPTQTLHQEEGLLRPLGRSQSYGCPAARLPAARRQEVKTPHLPAAARHTGAEGHPPWASTEAPRFPDEGRPS